MKNRILVFICLVPLFSIAQSVKGTFSPADDFTYAFLYKATPEGADYINRGQLDKTGSFEITLDSTITPGIYKIVYAIPPEENSFDFIYDGKETVAFNFSYNKGVQFLESEENKLWLSYLKSMEMVNRTISNYYAKGQLDKEGFTSIFKVLKDTQQAYEASAQDKLVNIFIIANRPYIPKGFEDVSTYSKNLKEHFLSGIDFSNNLLQSSSFLVDRINAFVFNMVENPTDDTYKSHIDDVADAISDNTLIIKTSLMEILWQRFVALKNHDMANYIADRYLLDLAIKTENKVIEQSIISYKNTSIGTKAPNFKILLGDTQTSLHQLDGAEHYLLIFWSSGCSHCLNELPEVKALAANQPNLKVVAYGLEDNDVMWSEVIKNYPDFIHVFGLGKWENQMVQTYGIAATPTYFLLDSDKVITAKPYDYEDLEKLLKATH
ncbi:MAG: redoxin family protein [Winogradskyella sp.]|uniref:redoxin family protein n=1 Tax=Winogradskyella sp. TaxID=1883156 RepID=UPI0017E99365|nr:redoxin family protein [Winogradskyella sp.]